MSCALDDLTARDDLWVLTIPGMRLHSLNRLLAMHWRKRSKLLGGQADQVTWHLLSRVGLRPPTGPLRVTIVRVGPQALDDDNATGAGKHVRDSIARYLDVDDGPDSGVTWVVRQERGSYAVRIEITRAGSL